MSSAKHVISELCKAAAEVAGVVFEVIIDKDMDDRYELAVRELAGRCVGALLKSVGKPNDSYQREVVRCSVVHVPISLGRMRVICDETNNTADLIDARAMRIDVHMDGGNAPNDKLSVLQPPAKSWFAITIRPLQLWKDTEGEDQRDTEGAEAGAQDQRS